MFGVVVQMKVWQQNMGSISTPENIPRLFDMVRVKDESVRPAFYFALRDTLVAKDLEQATRVAFQKDKRWRVVTLQGQIIEQAGEFPPMCNLVIHRDPNPNPERRPTRSDTSAVFFCLHHCRISIPQGVCTALRFPQRRKRRWNRRIHS